MVYAGVILVLAGLVGAAAGAVLSVQDRSRRGRATGVVVDVVEMPSTTRTSDGRLTTYRPIVSWRDPDGRDATFRGTMGGNPPRHRVGQPVHVAFDTTGRRAPKIAGEGRGLGVGFVLGGGVLLVVGVLLLVV